MAFMIAITVGYLLAVGPYRKRFSASEEVPLSKKVMFVSGMFLFYLAQGGPINFLSHMMFSFHMLAMALSYIIAPPLLMLGIPTWLWRAMLKYNPLRRLRFLMNPIFTAVLFNAIFSLYHIPLVHDYVMLHFGVHRLYYAVLLVTSIMMWWPILTPIPEMGKMQDVRKMGYIFVNSILITPACALIIFASTPLYATYNDADIWAQAMGYCFSGDPSVLLAQFEGPAFFNLVDPAQDQQIGGILMKMVQEVVNGSVLAYTFFHWYRRENKEEDLNEIPAGSNLNRV